MLQFTDETAPHQIAFEAYGVSARVCASSPELLARVEQLMPPGWQPRERSLTQHRLGIVAEPDGSFSVYNGAACVSERGSVELGLVVLDGQVRGYVAVNAPEHTFVHAGVVAHRGRAIVMPGHSFAGKTTLVAALVRAGAVYYSDEFAVFDRDGFVHPYAKPLSLRPPEASYVDRSVESLGGVAGEGPTPLGVVVVTHYVVGGEWSPKRVSRGAGALALLAHAVPMRYRPDDAMRTLTRALEHAFVLEGDRGEASETADRLLECVPA